MSVSRAPRAVSRYSGKPPDHIRIHVMGTPPSRWDAEAVNAAADLGFAAR